MARRTYIERIPKIIKDYFQVAYPKSEGYGMLGVYWYRSLGNIKYYGIIVYKNGELHSYPQATLSEYSQKLKENARN